MISPAGKKLESQIVRRPGHKRRGHDHCDTDVPTHMVTLTQVGTSVYLGQTHLGTPLQVPAWVIKFSLGSTGDEISSLIIIQSLYSRSLSIK